MASYWFRNGNVYFTNINHKGLHRTSDEYAEERSIYKDLITKNNKKTFQILQAKYSRGGGDSHMKGAEMLVGNFELNL